MSNYRPLTEEMFSTGQPVAQGEVLVWMKKYAPKRVVELFEKGEMQAMKLNSNQLIVGHSETGHHHVLEPVRAPKAKAKLPMDPVVEALVSKANDTLMYLNLKEPCNLTHQRSFDTHQGFTFPAGEYYRLIREEQSPEGWRRVAD